MGSANPLNVFLIPPNYDTIRKYNMAAKIAAVLGITLIRLIVILERKCWCLFVAEYTGTTPTAIGWLSHCSIQITCNPHQKGLWNGMWTDMYIETTLMKYCHGPGGIVGITLNEHALCRWALSLHICSRLTKGIADLKEATLFEVDHHKEESTSRVKADSNDRNAIRDKLETCVDPLDVSQGQNLINIVTGKNSKENVNVEDAVQIGEAQLQEFESACPTGFYQTIKMKIITMKEGKKQRGADPMEQCDSGLIFERVTALMSTRAINLNDVMKNELAAVLTSIFDEKSGELRILKSKSILKRRLQVEVINPSRGAGHAVVIDGCAILWVLQ